MKKRLLRSIFTLLLAALLMIGIPQTALAAPIEKTYTVRLADGIDEEIHSPDGSWIDDVVVVSGQLPYGVVVGHKEDIMYIIGVPAYAGTYEARVDMEIGGGAYQYLIRIIVQDPNAPVTITKHPTGETVTEGGSAVFISRADNATEIVWRLVSPDTKTTYECKDASKYFPGLEVLGLGTDTLILKNIPYALDGWKVEAKFFGKDGPVFSNGARITVNRSELQMPVISIQPQGAELQQGASVTLSVSATAPEGSLRYQWYRAESDASDGIAISGADSASLLVNDALGSGAGAHAGGDAPAHGDAGDGDRPALSHSALPHGGPARRADRSRPGQQQPAADPGRGGLRRCSGRLHPHDRQAQPRPLNPRFSSPGDRRGSFFIPFAPPHRAQRVAASVPRPPPLFFPRRNTPPPRCE